jgi:hypothetical protein
MLQQYGLRVALCLPILRDKSSCREFVFPRPLSLSFRIYYCNLVCLYILLELAVDCKILWDGIFTLIEF